MNRDELIQKLHHMIVNDMDRGNISYSDIMDVLTGAISNAITNKAINFINDGQMGFEDMVPFINDQMNLALTIIPETMQRELNEYVETNLSEYVVHTKDNVVPFNRTLN